MKLSHQLCCFCISIQQGASIIGWLSLLDWSSLIFFMGFFHLWLLKSISLFFFLVEFLQRNLCKVSERQLANTKGCRFAFFVIQAFAS